MPTISADDERGEDGRDRDAESDPRSVEQAREQVSSQLVRAEQWSAEGPCRRSRMFWADGVVWRELRREDDDHEQGGHDHESEESRRPAGHLA